MSPDLVEYGTRWSPRCWAITVTWSENSGLELRGHHPRAQLPSSPCANEAASGDTHAIPSLCLHVGPGNGSSCFAAPSEAPGRNPGRSACQGRAGAGAGVTGSGTWDQVSTEQKPGLGAEGLHAIGRTSSGPAARPLAPRPQPGAHGRAQGTCVHGCGGRPQPSLGPQCLRPGRTPESAQGADYHVSWAQVGVIAAQPCVGKRDAQVSDLGWKRSK